MAKIFYLLSGSAVSPNFFGPMQIDGTAPGAASVAGWQNAKTVTYFRIYPGNISLSTTGAGTSTIDGTSSPTKGTSATGTATGDCYATPTTLTGAFGATTWTLDWVLAAVTPTDVGRMRTRIWRSANADGTSATLLTSSTLVSSIVTLATNGVNVTSTVTWSPGAITLNNEYLFFQMEWEETTAGTSNTCKFNIQTGSKITAPDLGSASAPVLRNKFRTYLRR